MSNLYLNIINSFKEHSKNRIAMIYKQEELSYNDLYDNIYKIANKLASLDLCNKTICTLIPNHPIVPAIYFAATITCTNISAINPKFSINEIKTQIENSNPAAIIIDEDLQTSIDFSFLKINPDITITKKELLNHSSGKKDFSLFPKASETTAFISLPTSGTTSGISKQVTHSQRSFYCYLEVYKQLSQSSGVVDGYTIISSPCSYSGGAQHIMSALMLGMTCVLYNDNNSDIKQYYDLTIEYKPLHILLLTPVLMKLLNEFKDFDSVIKNTTFILTGGDSVPESLIKKIKTINNQVNLCSVYGSSEVGCIIANMYKDPESWSYLGTSTDISTLHLENNQLQVKGSSTYLGYLKNGKISEKATDWVTLDDKIDFVNGYYKFLGRAKNHIKVDGYNVYTNEIEKVIINFKNDLDVAIVSTPDGKRGACIFLFIKKISDYELLTLKKYLRENLAEYKVPKHFILLPEIPLTKSQKKDYAKLRSLAEKIILENH